MELLLQSGLLDFPDKSMRFVLIICIFCFCAVGCNKAPGPTAQALSSSSTNTQEQLVRYIRSSEPWTCYDPLPSDWMRTISAAKEFQRQNDRTVEAAFHTYFLQCGNSVEDISKSFILLRVIFELPESTNSGYALSQGWLGLPYNLTTTATHPKGYYSIDVDRIPCANLDGTFNLSWPLTWTNGNPKMLARYYYYEGSIYDPEAEYKLFVSNFPKRNLSKFP